jgi:hypothetical protein
MFEGRIPQSLNNIKGLRILNLTGNNLSNGIHDAKQHGRLARLVSRAQQLIRTNPSLSKKIDMLHLLHASMICRDKCPIGVFSGT